MLPTIDISKSRKYWKWFWIQDLEIMQFTWITDSKWIEIYEGDILECDWAHFECVFDMWSFEAKNWVEYSHLASYTGCDVPWDIEFATVIWNIYENPDLIK